VSDGTHAADTGEIVCEAHRARLAELLAFVDGACERAGVDAVALFDIHLAVEEVVTNVIEHGYHEMQAGLVTVRVRRELDRMVVTVEDAARPFDPAAVARPDTAAPLDERRIGGLGWHLVTQVMDEVRHEQLLTDDRRSGNRVTLVKRLSPTA
jgi:anti-sigma regulatory factor (Ser/Thr protein kinase)